MPLTTRAGCAALAAALLLPVPTEAGIALSRVVIDIPPGADAAQDIDIANDGQEVAYVVAEPFEITTPGQPGEARTAIVDPGVGGLLVSPQRLILQPGERKSIRIAAIAARGAIDRVYRVTVKPVAGPVSAPLSALKVLVGYDVLVIYRPAAPVSNVVGERTAAGLTLRNAGNSNVEMYDGKQCTALGACVTLPSKRLYAGQSWTQPLGTTAPVTYRVALGSKTTPQSF